MSNNIEVVVSFDTTGSMSPCIRQVRNVLKSMATELFREIPNFRMGMIAHGDYCDGKDYTIKEHELTTSLSSLETFIKECHDTNGGDCDECYELVLHRARSLNWTADKHKILIVIGDANPHGPYYAQNKGHLDWENEAQCLADMGIKIYAVQALGKSGSYSFYGKIASKSKGLHLNLDQFSEVVDLIKAICYQQVSTDRVQRFIETVEDKGVTITRTMVRNYEDLTGRTINFRDTRRTARYATTPRGLTPVSAGRFQVMDVSRDTTIQDYVTRNGLIFRPGKGFYEFTKSVKIQAGKEVVLQDKVTGDMFTGSVARNIIGIPEGNITICPKKTVTDQYRAFIQSKSYTRKLLKGTSFLYEVDESR